MRTRVAQQRTPNSPDIAPRDYVVVCVSTYPAELRALDAEVERRKLAGDRRASRSAVIREAVREMLERGHAALEARP